MLSSRQVATLIAIGSALWAITALYIRLLPQAFLDPLWGPVMFAATPVSIWLNVLLVRQLAGLSKPQILPGVCLVGAVALILEGLGMRWIPIVYNIDAELLRSGAAWVFWGYGLSLGIALFMSRSR
jgi:hypothetical protein